MSDSLTNATVHFVNKVTGAITSKFGTWASKIKELEVAVTLLEDGKEAIFSKNAAFNKEFGSGSGTVCEGNDSRLSDARTPTSHSHTITKSDVGLGNCDNTNDASKPISNATQTALNGKAASSHNHDSAYSASSHNHDSSYAAVDHSHSGSSELIDALPVQIVSYGNPPTAQSISVQINASDGDFATLTIWKSTEVASLAIQDTGCSVTSETPFIMMGTVAALNSNLAAMTVTGMNDALGNGMPMAIKIGVNSEEKEIVIHPLRKNW